MARLFTRINDEGVTRYYADVRIDGTRTRKLLATDYKSAQLALNKLEYELIFTQTSKETPKKEIPLNHAIISFLKEVESSGVSAHRIKTIKLNF